MCLMVADLLEFMPVSRDLRLAAGTGHRLRLAFSQSLGLYLGVYMHAPKRGQVWRDGACCECLFLRLYGKYIIPPWIWVCKAKNRDMFHV